MSQAALPPVALYAIGPDQAAHTAPLLTAEAVEAIQTGDAFGLALVEEGEARAAVCARLAAGDENTLELVSLYVAPAFRRRALGGTLLMELLEAVQSWTEAGVRRLTALFSPQVEGLAPFLEQAGFVLEEADQVVSWTFSLAQAADSPLLKRAVPLPAGAALRALADLPDYALRQLLRTLEENRIADVSLPELRRALPRASVVLLDRSGAPIACAVVSPAGEHALVLSQFFTAHGSPAAALAVLHAAAQALVDELPGDTTLEIPTLTLSSAKLVQRLAPESRATRMVRGILDLTRS